MLPGKKLRFQDTTASVLLDAIRGAAALLVLVEHWRNAFFVDYTELPGNRTLLNPLYLLCGTGHQAVMVFFVLSGYLISGSVFRSVQGGEWSWRQYLTHRLVRLWIVLLPALILGAFWDHLGIYLHQAPALYSGANGNHITPDVGHTLSFQDFMGNLAFLQTILVPLFGSNPALWSLSNEFWYYILFPLGVCIMGRVYRKALPIIICGALLCLTAVFVTRDILSLFPVWLMGALLHAIPVRPAARWFRMTAAPIYIALFFGSAGLYHLHRFEGVIADWTLGLVTAGFVWVLLGAVREAKPTAISRLSRAVARFSYTLYAAHMPILIFVVSLIAHDARWIPTLKTGAVAASVLPLVLGYAWLLATATEFRTEPVRGFVEYRMTAMTRKTRLPSRVP